MTKNKEFLKLALVIITVFSVSACDDESSSGTSNPDKPSPNPKLPIVQENASICFNPDLYKAGTEHTTKYQGGSLSSGTYREKKETTYRGQDAVELTESAGYIFYFSIDNANKSMTLLGADLGTYGERYNTPGKIERFDLNKGDDYTQTVTTTMIHNSIRTEEIIDETISFAGFETITVPAGTYQTCKFVTTGIRTKSDGKKVNISSSKWIAFEHGITVKEDDSELVEAKINGVEI